MILLLLFYIDFYTILYSICCIIIKTNTLMKKINHLFWRLRLLCFGTRIRERLFLEKLLRRSNRHWFAFPEKVYKRMCKDLSLYIRGNYAAFSDLWLDNFYIFQRSADLRAKRRDNVVFIPIHVLHVEALGRNRYQLELLQKNGDGYETKFHDEVEIPFDEIEKELRRL